MPPEVSLGAASRGDRRTLRRNDVIFDQGDPSYALYIVEEGRIAIAAQAGTIASRCWPSWRRRPVRRLALFDGARARAARALTDTTLLELRTNRPQGPGDQPSRGWWGAPARPNACVTPRGARRQPVPRRPARTSKRLLDLRQRRPLHAARHPKKSCLDGGCVPGAGQQGHLGFVRRGGCDRSAEPVSILEPGLRWKPAAPATELALLEPSGVALEMLVRRGGEPSLIAPGSGVADPFDRAQVGFARRMISEFVNRSTDMRRERPGQPWILCNSRKPRG